MFFFVKRLFVYVFFKRFMGALCKYIKCMWEEFVLTEVNRSISLHLDLFYLRFSYIKRFLYTFLWENSLIARNKRMYWGSGIK